MKKILFFSLMLACIFSFGKCNKKKKCCTKKTSTETSSAKLSANEVWMQYDETKCENPWHFNWFVKPTEAQIMGAVNSQLTGQEISILEIQSTYEEGMISCDACNCRNGRHFYVRVNKSEIEKLKALKFYELKEIPKTKSIDTTK
ncbi:MAG: hypothetical protein IT271_13550 [Chitinophagales bacterium]|nr:hypothetical protein [Chitinophagales bacterium]